jgi:hypothetical protein
MNHLAVVLGTALLSAFPCAALEIKSGDHVLRLSGTIYQGDNLKLRAYVDNHGKDTFAHVEITSNGGDVETALRISDIVNYDMAKPLYVVGPCLSACAFIALAATRHLIVKGTIAVHQPWTGSGTPDLPVARTVIFWLRNCGVSESILNKILNTTPQDMTTISRDELKAMGARVE